MLVAVRHQESECYRRRRPDSIDSLDRAQAVEIILNARELEHFLRSALFHEVSMNVNDEGA